MPGVLLLAAAPLLVAPVQDAERELVASLLEEYRARGLAIEPVEVVIASSDETRAYFERHLIELLGAEYFETAHVLLRALGVDAGEDPADVLEEVSDGLAETLLAHYRTTDGALVFLRNELRGLADLLGIEPLVAHELAHAWQFQQGDPLARLGPAPTLERVRLFDCMLEGQAEVLALGLLAERKGVDLARLDPDDFENPVGRLFSGPLDLPYSSGRRFLLGRLRAGGWEAVHAAAEDPPPSTEQVMHAEKLDGDAPVAVDLPDWPADALGEAELVRVDVVGELGLYGLLLAAGVEDADAYPAVVGWDGDRIAYHRRADGSWATIWRTVWDREEDAEQFRRLLRRRAEGRSAARGRVVDWAWADGRLDTKRLLDRLEAHPLELPEESDGAASTAAVEAAFAAANDDSPRIVGSSWYFPALEMAVPVPDGWTMQTVNGTSLLFAPPGGEFRDNLNVLTMPNPMGFDLQQLLEANREQIESLEGFGSVQGEIVELDGVRVTRFEYSGEVLGHRCSFLAIGGVDADRQWFLTASTLAERWPERAPFFEEVFAGIRFGVSEEDLAEPAESSTVER